MELPNLPAPSLSCRKGTLPSPNGSVLFLFVGKVRCCHKKHDVSITVGEKDFRGEKTLFFSSSYPNRLTRTPLPPVHPLRTHELHRDGRHRLTHHARAKMRDREVCSSLFPGRTVSPPPPPPPFLFFREREGKIHCGLPGNN